MWWLWSSLSAVCCSSLLALMVWSVPSSPPSSFITSASPRAPGTTQMFNLERLTYAMAEHEGWKVLGSPGAPSGSRAFRNHNPGNLRASPLAVGQAGGFAVFRTDDDGFAAMRLDIRQKARGNTSTGLNGNSTLAQLIAVWAPASDGNSPSAYLAHVCQLTGFKPDMRLAEFL